MKTAARPGIQICAKLDVDERSHDKYDCVSFVLPLTLTFVGILSGIHLWVWVSWFHLYVYPGKQTTSIFTFELSHFRGNNNNYTTQRKRPLSRAKQGIGGVGGITQNSGQPRGVYCIEGGAGREPSLVYPGACPGAPGW